MSNEIIVFDLEANGFLDQADTIWCIAARNLESREEYFFGPDEIQEGLDFLATSNLIVAHNGIGYDYPLIQKLYPNWVLPKYEDSLILSRLANPDRKGGHSVEEWGKKFGQLKPEHEDWSQYSDAMGHRCQEDTRIQCKIVRTVMNELSGHDWSDAIRLEYDAQWLQNQVEARGALLSEEASATADTLEAKLATIKLRLDDVIPTTAKQKGTVVTKPFTIQGKVSARAAKLAPEDQISGPFTGIEWQQLNLNSPKQLTDYLYSLGWEPDEFNYKKAKRGGYELNADGTYAISSPKVTESSLATLDHPLARHLKNYRVLKHRLSILRNTKRSGELTGWLNNLRDDGRISARAIPLGTNTGRYTHSNIVNLPTVEADYGTEIRSLIVAPEGKILAGTDATGIQARMSGVASYPYDNGDLFRDLLTGDVHDKNAAAFTEAAQREITRSQGKAIGYALKFGARTRKIATMMHTSLDIADAMIEAYWDANEGEAAAVEKYTADAKQNGWVRGLDGRRIYIRSPHSAYNALLQNMEAILMKHVFLMMGKEFDMVLHMHDELLSELDSKDQAYYLANTQHVGQFLTDRFDLPERALELDTKFGNNYAEVH